MDEIGDVPDVGCYGDARPNNDFVVASGGGASDLPLAIKEKSYLEKYLFAGF
jgi:hypothetical protein